MTQVAFVSDVPERYPGRLGAPKTTAIGALDTGGTADYAALNVMRVDKPRRLIVITGQRFWKVSERDGMTFAQIRNEVALIYRGLALRSLAVEANNYGRSEIEGLRREYGIRARPVNTSGRITSEDVIRRGDTMDKEQVIRKFNSWRQNAVSDPKNEHLLGQVRVARQRTPELERLMQEFDNFVRVDAQGTGASARPKFGAAGRGHDDGVMSCLLNFYAATTWVFGMGGGGTMGGVSYADMRGGQRGAGAPPSPIGRTIGHIGRDGTDPFGGGGNPF